MFCPNCGSEIPENVKFCPKCGAKAKTKVKSGKKKIRWGFIVGAVAVLIVAVVVWGGRPIEDGVRPKDRLNLPLFLRDALYGRNAHVLGGGGDTFDGEVDSGVLRFSCDSDGTASVYWIGDEEIKKLVIPSKVKVRWRKYSIPKTYSVTEIESNAFAGRSSLTSIELPDSVTKIGYRAFYKCDGLRSIEFSGGVTEIENDAFRECSSLTSIELPASVTKIGDSAFYNCGSLTSIEIPDGVTEIGSEAFRDCSSLKSIELPASVTEIAYNVCYNCSSLERIKYGELEATRLDRIKGNVRYKIEDFVSGSAWINYLLFNDKSGLK